MLKIRLMGTKDDITWFKNNLNVNPEIEILDSSDFYTNKGTTKYYRSYVEIQKKDNKKNN